MRNSRKVRKGKRRKLNCRKTKKGDCKSNWRKSRKKQRGGSPCSFTTPFVGPSWQAYGPPTNGYVPKPWYKSNNSNYYALSKTGINVGGYPVFDKQNGGKSKRQGKRNRRNTKKILKNLRNSRNLGLKGGGIIAKLFPQPIVNLGRSLNNSFWNYLPTGNVWSGLPKTESPFPYVQPNVQK